MKRSLITALVGLTAVAAQAVNLTTNYAENFDSMGPTGTAAPTGWSFFSMGAGNATWTDTTGVLASGFGSPVLNAALIVATPPSTNSGTAGINAGLAAFAVDRALATAPTGTNGSALQLSVTNTSGGPLSGVYISYDTRRFTVASADNELPGYWLFYSLDGGTTWTNVTALNPTLATVPNTVGVTTTPSTLVTLSSALANSATVLLRWVDDNAQQSSPDQIIGLDNVTLAVFADPANTALQFDGVNDYVTMGAATATLGTPVFTLECWFKRTGTGVAASTGTNGLVSAIPLVAKGRGEADATATVEDPRDCNYFMGINSATNQLCADFEAKLQTPLNGTGAGNNNYPVIGGTVLSNDTWYHAAAVWNGSGWKLYINGVEESITSPNSLPVPAPVPQSASIQHFALGSALDSTGTAAGFFQGAMDEVRIWSIARTTAQIAALKDGPIATATPGLLARFGMNEGSGSTTSNSVGTAGAPLGSLTNGPLWAAGAPLASYFPPTVALTAPLASDSFIAPATLNLAATASDSNGTIAKVEFYNAATKLGEDSSTPYAFTWSGVSAGIYSLSARATDNEGNVSVSATTSVSVNATAGSGTLTRAAYLQQAAPTTMTIRWRSSQSIAGRVKYGASAASLTNTANAAASTTEHEVTLTGLTANTTYFYSIGSAFDTLAGGDAAHTFTTPPPAGSTANFRVWVLGDAGTGTASQTSVRDAFYTWTGAHDPNLVLQLGDNAYNSGLDSEFQAKVFDIYGSLMKRVPFWSCLGNHETNQATSFVDTYPYFSIYTFPKAAQCGGVASGTEHYYSFDYGNIHFISLDSMTASRSATGAMATWLTADLASNTQTWVVAFFHHPPYTKGSHDSDTETGLIEMRTNLLPILETGGVDLVLCGHSHSYERSYLLDGHYGLSNTLTAAMKKNAGDGRPGGNGAYIKPLTGPRDHFGAVYAVAGSSGQTSGGSLNHPAHFISLNNLGSLVLDVSANRLDATFIRENASLPDTFTLIKQGAADTDGDGIPDAYEMANGLDRKNPADALTSTDADGLSNFLEFAFGLNPHVNDGRPVEVDIPNAVLTKRGTPAVWYQTITNGTDFRVIFIRRKDAGEAGLVYTPQFSGDLVNWANSSLTPTVVADGGEVEAVSLDYPLFAAGQKARYFRVALSSTH